MSKTHRISSVMPQRKCACDGSSGLTGSCCFDCEKKKLLDHPLKPLPRKNLSRRQRKKKNNETHQRILHCASAHRKELTS
jgi:hypothetical protein